MKKGFTLVELIIVIAVIGILAATLIVVLPNVIDSANAKSALSDAKNTETSYISYLLDNGSYSDDCIIIVKKSLKLYLFGLLDGQLQSCVSHPFEVESISSFTATLLSKNIIKAAEDRPPEDVTAYIDNLSQNITVFTGYRLVDFITDIYFSESLVNIEPGEERQLSAVVMPQAKIEYSSGNTDIASVDENGKVLGISAGMTDITAVCGGKTAVVTVNVVDYIDFYGNAQQLKEYIEETGSATIYLRIMSDIYSNDVSFLPYQLPENKTVKIDINGKSVFFEQSVDSGEGSRDCIIRNNGGTLILENSSKTGGELSASFGIKSGSAEAYYSAAVCNKKGTVQINASYNKLFAENSVDELSASCGIDNYDRLYFENVDTYVPKLDDHYSPVPHIFVHNGKGGHAAIHDIDIIDSIVNEGVIEKLENCKIGGNAFGIKNTGTILSVKNCEIRTIYQLGNSAEKALISTGRITSISNSKFVAGIHTDEDAETVSGTAFAFDGGTVGSIKNCSFIGSENAVSANESSVLENKLTDGTYSHTVPDRFIAAGYSCVPSDGAYAIVHN